MLDLMENRLPIVIELKSACFEVCRGVMKAIVIEGIGLHLDNYVGYKYVVSLIEKANALVSS